MEFTALVVRKNLLHTYIYVRYGFPIYLIKYNPIDITEISYLLSTVLIFPKI